MDSKTTEETVQKRQKLHFDPAEYHLRKRLPFRLPRRKNDVYITRKTNFKVQLERSKKLLDEGENDIIVHGLGAAIDRAINLALTLKSMFGGLIDISVNTSTVEVKDDFEPKVDDLETVSQTRNLSAAHIKVFKVSTMEKE